MGVTSTDFPAPIPGLRRKTSWLMRTVGRTYLRLSGWRIEGQFPSEPKCVLIVVPHTSNWDFMLGVAFLYAVGLRVSWLAKHTLFKPPFQGFLKKIGGIPVDRRASHGVVGQCIKAFDSEPALLITVAPEGTRKGPSRWKSGFYRIALGAGVPIFPVAFDFGEHVLRLMPVFHPTGDLEGDMKVLQGLFVSVRGCRVRPTEDSEEQVPHG